MTYITFFPEVLSLLLHKRYLLIYIRTYIYQPFHVYICSWPLKAFVMSVLDKKMYLQNDLYRFDSYFMLDTQPNIDLTVT